MHSGEIRITNKATEAVIDIEGVIGIPEWWQFDNPDERVATYDKFKKAVGEIKEIDNSLITVNIRSIGGSVNDALLIHDTLAGLGATVTTTCYGYVASAATIIAQAASAGRRNISENALYLIHQGSSCVSGNIHDMEKTIDLLEKTDGVIANLYAKRSGRPAEEFASLMSENNGNGKWLTPEEAMEAGLVDTVIRSSSVTNTDMTFIHNLKLPDVPADKQIKNTKHMKMTLKESWKGLLNFFGLEKDAEVEITDAELERINNEMEARNRKITDLTENVTGKDAEVASLKKEIADKDSEIVNLQRQVANKQAEIDKFKAGPTRTKDIEDPEPTGEQPKNNASAYEEDIKNFK